MLSSVIIAGVVSKEANLDNDIIIKCIKLILGKLQELTIDENNENL
jgi:hypothetical protein